MAVHDVAAGEARGAKEAEPSARAVVVIRVFILAGSPFASAVADATDNADRTGRRR